jgi:hypothetical protein
MVMVVLPPELEELELEELELEELLLDELDEELDEEDELELLDEALEELLDDELLELDELEVPPPGTEHSLIPPGTRVPAPNVTSPQIKLPFSVMNVNWSLRPNATFVGALTVQLSLPALVVQMVT